MSNKLKISYVLKFLKKKYIKNFLKYKVFNLILTSLEN